MSTTSVIRSIIQKKGVSAMNKAFDNANEVAAKENNVGPKQKGKK